MIQMIMRMALRVRNADRRTYNGFCAESRLALVILCVMPLLAFAIYNIMNCLPRFTAMQKKLDALNIATRKT